MSERDSRERSPEPFRIKADVPWREGHIEKESEGE